MNDESGDAKVFEIIYKLTHLAEVYDQYVAFSTGKGQPVKSLLVFAKQMVDNGTPYADGLNLKKTVEHNTVVPIFDLYKLYQEYPGSPDLSIEDFTYHHKTVDKFRRHTGIRSHLAPE